MEANDILDVLRLYRHDMMNELQVVQGYASMGKIDKVEEKVRNWVGRLDEERKLMHLGLPAFVLWVIQFSSRYTTIHLTYEVDSANEQQVSHTNDQQLYETCQAFVKRLLDFMDRTVLYQAQLKVSCRHEAIYVLFFIQGSFVNLDIRQLNTIKYCEVEEDKYGVCCAITYPYNE